VVDNEEGAESDGGRMVQSLVRGLRIITAFDAGHAAMTMSEVARRTNIPRAAVGRFLRTLEDLNYLRAVEGGRYVLTPRVLELGYGYLSSLTLPEVAQPHLEELSAEVGESSSASVLDGGDIVYVARVPTRRIMGLRISIGTRFPAAVTSMGRVLLSGLTDDEVDRALALRPLETRTSHTISSPGQLRDELAAVRERGYALVDEELESGLRSIAVPVRRGDSGPIIAAVNVSTSTARHSVDAIVDELLPPLRRAADGIGAELVGIAI
jgi:IclR family pca regulon transcriptional regulator